jgi:nucleolar protein 56
VAEGWFAGLARSDAAAARTAVREGRADAPADWPTLAVGSGFATDGDDYYDALHEATAGATREAAREAGRADDKQLVHAVRAMDDDPRAG